jgi:hypothetical protein
LLCPTLLLLLLVPPWLLLLLRALVCWPLLLLHC